jgi:hypothetical protein
MLSSCGDRVAFPEVGREAQQADAAFGGKPRQVGRASRRHAVVDEQHVTDLGAYLGHELRVGRREVRRNDRGDVSGIELNDYAISRRAFRPTQTRPRPIETPRIAPAATSRAKCTPR